MEKQAGSRDGNNRRVSDMAYGVFRKQSQAVEMSVAKILKFILDIFEICIYTISRKLKLCINTNEMRYQNGRNQSRGLCTGKTSDKTDDDGDCQRHEGD